MRNTLQKISVFVPSPVGRVRVGVLFLLLPFTFYAQTNTFPASGNVGIGTTSPEAKLQVNNTGTIGAKWNPSNSYLTIKDNSNAMIIDPNEIYSSQTIRIGTAAGDIKFGSVDETGATDNMVIKRNGNIGIGTVSPDAKLTVKGNIHTREVKVDLNGAVAPDYVFKKDYNLRSLEDVQAFIEKNGHLPGIPSAKEMETDGVNLKEMNLKLLEKVEELTLYVIQQHEYIKALKK
ncbi:hypothetical protein SAMN02927921_04184 [Sinomicrobium oceani]|uniref:Uncharacterized protein n=1 Tax=Sinomicrobium oceani TaxID=1150368 RepID=A0A1K1RY58_9FLAO|nr:tail fiber protein [Sinomicrobium oceani]SFW77001.1 hypothetical protein SAMN02927921_04184 [Sinomicrobium oceani]